VNLQHRLVALDEALFGLEEQQLLEDSVHLDRPPLLLYQRRVRGFSYSLWEKGLS
jgi:hypothetical protein